VRPSTNEDEPAVWGAKLRLAAIGAQQLRERVN